ncbi:hypothetical protein ACLED1_13550 [Lonsdalea quercina]|uniref:hypothetical protein n=1 Tax=Lonsdalea quercina TaxID=71657 RepID=UPI003976AAF1
MTKKVALLPENSRRVENVILTDDQFAMPGYRVAPIAEGVFCEAGMFLNDADGLFYQDADFTVIYPARNVEAIG